MLSPIDFKTQNRTKMNCNETLFEMVTAIEAYPFSGVSSTRTMSILGKHVDEEELGLDKSAKTEVPMKQKSCSINEKYSVDIPGDSYEVNVSWEMRIVGKDTYKVLESMKEYPKHLILRTY